MIKAEQTVLVVDDSMFMRKYLNGVLSENNYNVIAEASNGKDAIALYREVKPDLVLLDFTLPDKNGIYILREIIRIDSLARVVMCSSMGQKRIVIEALQSGAKDFIVKPNFHQLIPTIDKVLKLSNL